MQYSIDLCKFVLDKKMEKKYINIVKQDMTLSKGGLKMTNYAKLKGLMVERGLEVNKLAIELGISRQATSDKINGKSKISLTDAQVISKALKMTSEERDAIFFAECVQ